MASSGSDYSSLYPTLPRFDKVTLPSAIENVVTSSGWSVAGNLAGNLCVPKCKPTFGREEWVTYLAGYVKYILHYYSDEGVSQLDMTVVMHVHAARAMLRSSTLAKYVQLNFFCYYFLSRLCQYPTVAAMYKKYRVKLLAAQHAHAKTGVEGFHTINLQMRYYWHDDEWLMVQFTLTLYNLVWTEPQYFDEVTDFLANSSKVQNAAIRSELVTLITALATGINSGTVNYMGDLSKFSAMRQQYVCDPAVYHTECVQHIRAVVSAAENCDAAYTWLSNNHNMRPVEHAELTTILFDVIYEMGGCTVSWHEKLRDIGRVTAPYIIYENVWPLIRDHPVSDTYLALLITHIVKCTHGKCAFAKTLWFIIDFIVQVGRARLNAMNHELLPSIRRWLNVVGISDAESPAIKQLKCIVQ